MTDRRGDRGDSHEDGIHVVPGNLREQPLQVKDERTVLSNTSLGAAITGPSRIVTEQPELLDMSGSHTTVFPHGAYSPGAYSPSDQVYYYGGYDNNTGHWGDYSNYVNANNMQILPSAMYNDNQSLMYHHGYGYDTQVAYGQYPSMANPLSQVMVDGQLYSPHQFPMTPTYYPQTVSPSMPHVSSDFPNPQPGMRTQGISGQEGLNDNAVLGQGPGYYVHFGSFDGELLPNQSNTSDMGSYYSPMTSTVYPQPVGILGSYEHNTGQLQASQQHIPYHGYEFASGNSTRRYPHNSSYQNSNYNSGSISHWEANRLKRFTHDKSGTRERERDSISISSVSHGISSERNRGPRASKPKGKNTEETSAPGVSKNSPSTSGVILDQYNQPDFVTNNENAKFFVIKSFSEDNVHKSIKYSVWASTPLGNRKLDAAYHQAKEMNNDCPIFLFFSVNASGQFCGVAEMTGPVDFENDADYWQQDRWSGQFPVKWHIVKDVSNSRFRHILLDNNDNKPVTHSRDCQEVKAEQGNEMLKIFKEHVADTSLLDDFNFYNEREKGLRENKSVVDTSTINEKLSSNFAAALKLDDTTDSNNQVVPPQKTA